MKRRIFLNLLGLSLFGASLSENLFGAINRNKNIKPVEGSWFEFQHHSLVEGKYWNQVLEKFTAEQWDEKIKEIADAGIRYLVLLDVAIYDKSFYPSVLLPQHKLACEDPLETILAAADKYGIRFFISNGFFGDWIKSEFIMKDNGVKSLRFKAMSEIAIKYSHHKSFYGWYFPNETGINGHYEDSFIDYVNDSSSEASRLMPNTKTLIAPYGTRNVSADDKFIRQIESLNVNFIAYQDEVGVNKTKVEESGRYFEQLHKLHQKAGRAKLWADVEFFRFEGQTYKSALLPASVDRVMKQLEAVSPFVDKIFIYQYIGLVNKPGTDVFAGHPDSALLYEQLFAKKKVRKS